MDNNTVNMKKYDSKPHGTRQLFVVRLAKLDLMKFSRKNAV